MAKIETITRGYAKFTGLTGAVLSQKGSVSAVARAGVGSYSVATDEAFGDDEEVEVIVLGVKGFAQTDLTPPNAIEILVWDEGGLAIEAGEVTIKITSMLG